MPSTVQCRNPGCTAFNQMLPARGNSDHSGCVLVAGVCPAPTIHTILGASSTHTENKTISSRTVGVLPLWIWPLFRSASRQPCPGNSCSADRQPDTTICFPLADCVVILAQTQVSVGLSAMLHPVQWGRKGQHRGAGLQSETEMGLNPGHCVTLGKSLHPSAFPSANGNRWVQ